MSKPTIRILSRPEPEPTEHKESDNKITITHEDVDEDRYHRFRLIKWWDQQILKKSRVLVIGAGAVGNEVLKNLALLGVGQILVYDLDTIEDSNLTRSVLFRQSDIGRYKADAAADMAMQINPDCNVVPVVGNVIYDLGLGVVAESDVVLGCLDNIEARFQINRACYRAGKVFIDAGLDHLNGDVRAYGGPDHPCYECGLNEYDRKTLEKQMSCLKLVRSDGISRAIPTVPTISSIVAGLQVQIAVRHLHNLKFPRGRRMGLYGLSDVWFDTELSISESCGTHNWVDPLGRENLRDIPLSAASATCNELLDHVEAELGTGAVVEVDDRDLIISLNCSECGNRMPYFGVMGLVAEEQAVCSNCGELCGPEVLMQLNRQHPYGKQTLQAIGIPPGHVLTAKNREGFEYRSFILAKDIPNYWKPRGK